jgi:hypothetical protein
MSRCRFPVVFASLCCIVATGVPMTPSAAWFTAQGAAFPAGAQ